MSASAILALTWCVLANIVGMLPSKRHKHWPAFYVLLGFSIPLIGFLFAENGIWVTLLFMLAMASIFRWPLYYLKRWIIGPTNRDTKA